MQVLVIGGTGFIGPYVARRLATRGLRVSVYHRGKTTAELPPEVVHILGERDQLYDRRAELAELAPDVVLDMRPLIERHAELVMATFRGTAQRVVAISSGDVYRAYGVLRGSEPGPPDRVPLREDAPLRSTLYPYRGPTPRPTDDPTAWTDLYDKILIERRVLADPLLPGTVLRLPMVYGPGDDAHRLFPYVKRIDDGRPVILVDEQAADWRWTRGYVEDVAAGIVAAVLSDRAVGRVYNVGESEALSERSWIEAIGRAAGWRGEIVGLPREFVPSPQPAFNYAQNLITDTSRIRAELGYCETLSLDERLARTIAWERSHPPVAVDLSLFNYPAEDAALASRRGGNR
jgi:nucleoside-diphosphate-sugar epimerase